MDKINELEIQIKEMAKDVSIMRSKLLNSEPVRYESSEIHELATALAKAQGEMETAKLDSTNPFFKSTYADFNSIIKASRPSLSKHGLSVIQRVLPNGSQGFMYLHSRLLHSSGQWIESKMLINPPKSDVQSLGSYLTYLKRYSYSALV